jgi:hypothetical protein
VIALDRPLDAAALRAHQRRHSGRPWSPELVAAVAAGNALGLFLLVVTWWETSTTGILRTQMSWIEVGLAGLTVAGAANALWILRARQALTLARVALLHEASLDTLAAAVGASTPMHASAALVTAPGSTRVHREGCVFVAGRVVQHVTGEAAAARGLAGCQVCQP